MGEAAGEHRLTVDSWSPAPGRSSWFCAVRSNDSPRGAAPTGGGGACGICVGAPPRGEALGFALFARTIRREARLLQGGRCLRHLCRSPAPGRSSWFCGVRSNDSPRGAAPTGGGRCLRHLCRSPAPGRSFQLCSVLSICRRARLLVGRCCVSRVSSPPRRKWP